MGRPKDPLSKAIASGAVAKNPQRYRDRMEEPRCHIAIGPPPAAYLPDPKTGFHSTEAKALLAIWEDLIAQAEAGNVEWTFADRTAVRNLCKCQRTIDASLRPQSGQLAQARAYLSELGLTPGGRTRVAARKAKEVDKRTPDGWAAVAEERAQAVQ